MATATPTPTPGAVPSERDVTAARAAVDRAGADVARLDAAYTAASARLERVEDDAAAATEGYNDARLGLEAATRASADADARAREAGRDARGADLLLRRFAAQSYMEQGGASELELIASDGGPQEVADRVAMTDIVGDLQADALRQATVAVNLATETRRQAEAARAQLAAAEQKAAGARESARSAVDEARAQAARIAGEQQALVVRLAQLRRTSVAVERRRQDALAADAERRAAEEARRRVAAASQEPSPEVTLPTSAPTVAPSPRPTQRPTTRPTPRPTRTTRPTQPPAPTHRPTPTPTPTRETEPPPPSSSGAERAIVFARAQIGKPYIWGGEGPDGYDCSGLTMMAWREAGVYLSHGSRAQYRETSRVAIDDLRPGDLVFFGSSPETNHHVGLYIGGGRMIEAARPGTAIRTKSIYRDDLLPYGGRPG